MNKLGVVIAEIYRKNVKSWSFLVMVFGPILFFAIFGAIGYFMGADAAGTDNATIALVSDETVVNQTLSSLEAPHVTIVSSVDEAQTALKDEKVDGYLVVTKANNRLAATYYSQTTDKKVKLDSISQVLTQLNIHDLQQKLGLTEAQVGQIEQSTVTTATQEIKFDKDGKAILPTDAAQAQKQELERGIQLGAAYLVGVLIFMFITTYTGMISQEVASEKGTRIMEVILSSISASTHFYGKIIGVMLVIFTQIAIYIVLGGIAFNIPMTKQLMAQYLPSIDVLHLVGPMLWYALIFFILGVLIYISLSAFVGSLATNTEDVQKSMAPVIFTGVIGFYAGMYGIANPNNIVVKIASYIPVWTPMVMPFRIASDTVSGVELAISVGLLVIGTVVVFMVSAMFYRSNVLVYTDTTIAAKLKRSLTILKSERKVK